VRLWTCLQGVFGCHMALVLRRLRRLCLQQYNSAPRFIVTSATMADPLAHARLLLGAPLSRPWVDC
jgi:DEAD/DEAH box helicase domain-containing protein